MSTTRKMRVIGPNYELSTIVDEEDYQTLRLWEYKWHRLIGRYTTYVVANTNGRTIGLHRIIMGTENSPRSVFVDHIDRNGLNNSRTNLRITDNSGNQGNRPKRLSAKNTSTYKGVCRDAYCYRSKPWHAQITLSGKTKNLGRYRTQEEAALAYNKAAIEVFGPLAHLNIIDPK